MSIHDQILCSLDGKAKIDMEDGIRCGYNAYGDEIIESFEVTLSDGSKWIVGYKTWKTDILPVQEAAKNLPPFQAPKIAELRTRCWTGD